MALQAAGGTPPTNSISFSEIATEFGYPTDNKFGNYRINQTLGGLSNLPLDSGVPQSGEIKFSDFYSKRLNVVVDFYSGASQSRMSAKDNKWANNKLTVLGPKTTKPSNTSGKKIIVHVNKTLYSANSNNRQICALRTGSWDSGTTLQVDIGAEGVIRGAGGNGGNGASGRSDYGPTSGGGDGQNGNSALGIEYNDPNTVVNVLSGGKIFCGYGGGAGGRGARQVDSGADRTAVGGGGGGGAGYPAGEGGSRGSRVSGGEDEVATDGGGNGSDGNATSGGSGGSGGNNINEAIGQTGGVGGDSEQSPGTATGGSNVGSGADPGTNASAGNNGAAIRRISGYTVTVNNSGTIRGSTTATGVA
tara:strand:- start:755 stop:1837 length:1083 start_codon:yes stop_codon:yes gene_type:complete